MLLPGQSGPAVDEGDDATLAGYQPGLRLTFLNLQANLQAFFFSTRQMFRVHRKQCLQSIRREGGEDTITSLGVTAGVST